MSKQDMALERHPGHCRPPISYLEEMTAHHEGACDMARDEVTDGQNPQAIEDQKAQMEQTLKRALSKDIPGPPQKRHTTSRSNQDLRKVAVASIPQSQECERDVVR